MRSMSSHACACVFTMVGHLRFLHKRMHGGNRHIKCEALDLALTGFLACIFLHGGEFFFLGIKKWAAPMMEALPLGIEKGVICPIFAFFSIKDA